MISTRRFFWQQAGCHSSSRRVSSRTGQYLEVSLRTGRERRRRFPPCIPLLSFAIGIPGNDVGACHRQKSTTQPRRSVSTRSPPKNLVSWWALMGVVAAFMILAFYTAVAGWTLEYIYQTLIGGFRGKSSDELSTMFDTFRSRFAQACFMVRNLSCLPHQLLYWAVCARE